MNARVIVEYTIRDICDQSDLDDTGLTFEQMVRDLIASEGILGLCDLPETIVSIEQA